MNEVCNSIRIRIEVQPQAYSSTNRKSIMEMVNQNYCIAMRFEWVQYVSSMVLFLFFFGGGGGVLAWDVCRQQGSDPFGLGKIQSPFSSIL